MLCFTESKQSFCLTNYNIALGIPEGNFSCCFLLIVFKLEKGRIMKITENILRILGILFFSYRAYIAYHRIDFESEDASMHSFTFYVWLMLIFFIVLEFILNLRAKIKKNKYKKIAPNHDDLKKIQEEYNKKIVSKTP
jgi:hypothetical protein